MWQEDGEGVQGTEMESAGQGHPPSGGAAFVAKEARQKESVGASGQQQREQA